MDAFGDRPAGQRRPGRRQPVVFCRCTVASSILDGMGAIVLAALLLLEFIRNVWLGREVRRLALPAASMVLLSIAFFGWLQGASLFSVEDTKGWSPPSVEIQRWFLGNSDPQLDQRFGTAANLAPTSLDTPSRVAWPVDAKLAMSVEPLHTRAAVGGMTMVALMVWIGAAAFSTRGAQTF